MSIWDSKIYQADTPGVLIAFWRLAVATVVCNLYVWSTGRHVTMRHVRQAVLPGAFFGLNLAIFFAGATNNSVANAALIGSLAPVLQRARPRRKKRQQQIVSMRPADHCSM